jgi:hypothetical protein
MIVDDWQSVVSMMPTDFEKSVRDDLAIQRARKVRDGSTLLRLALIYATVGGLRVTAALASQQGITDISDVALLKRLCEGSTWLAGLPAKLLADRRQFDPGKCRSSRRIRCVDATCVKRPGCKGTAYRVHVGFSLSECCIDHVEVTDASGGETFKRIPVEKGDLLVGDRGYAHARGISAAAVAGADVIVRMNWSNLPLTDTDGRPLDILAHLRSLADGEIGDWPVCTVGNPAKDVLSVSGRLVGMRKDEKSAEAARCKALKEARKQKRKVSPETLESAAYIFLFTTVSTEEMSAEQCLEIFRFRWQIELSFKNLKGVFGLSKMAAKSSKLSIAFISAILIASILVDRMTNKQVFFSPWEHATQQDHLCSTNTQAAAPMLCHDRLRSDDHNEDDGRRASTPPMPLRCAT